MPIAGGIQVDVFDGSTFEMIDTLQNAYDINYQENYNAVGVGSFYINRHDPKATLNRNLQLGNLIRLKDLSNGLYFGAFFIEEPSLVALSPKGSDQEYIQVQGRDINAYLDDWIVYPTNWPTDTTTVPSYKAADGWTVGGIVIDQISKGQALGFLSKLIITFSGSDDSEGIGWANYVDVTLTLGATMLDVLTQLASMVPNGASFSLAQDFKLYMSDYKNNPPNDLSGTVIFRAGKHLGSDVVTGGASSTGANPSNSNNTSTWAPTTAGVAVVKTVPASPAYYADPITRNTAVEASFHGSPITSHMLVIGRDGTAVEQTYPTWATGTAYTRGAAVEYGGRYYTATVANTGNEPDTSPGYWSMFLQRPRAGRLNYFPSRDPTQLANAGLAALMLSLAQGQALTVPVSHGTHADGEYTPGQKVPPCDYIKGDIVTIDIPGLWDMVPLQIVSLNYVGPGPSNTIGATDYEVILTLGAIPAGLTTAIAAQMSSLRGNMLAQNQQKLLQGGGVASTTRHPMTYAVSGALAVASGAVGYLPPFVMPVPNGQYAKLVQVTGLVRTGNVSIEVTQNGAVVPGLSALAISTVATSSTPTSVIEAVDGDLFAPVITSVGGCSVPDGLTLTFIFDFTSFA